MPVCQCSGKAECYIVWPTGLWFLITLISVQLHAPWPLDTARRFRLTFTPITLPGGYSVWQQPTTPPGQAVTGTQYPWQLSSGTFPGAQPPSPEVSTQTYGGTSTAGRPSTARGTAA